MIGTLFGLIAAAFLWLYPFADLGNLKPFMIAVAILLALIPPFGVMLGWSPIQRAQQYSSPQILEMFRTDKHIWLLGSVLVAFLFVTFLSIGMLQPLVFMGWVVLLGVSIDAARHFLRRITNYLNPLSVVTMFGKEAQKSIQNDREIDLCQWIDGLSEVAIKGIQQHSSSVCHAALDEIQSDVRLFLEASKSIGHAEQDKQTQAYGITDKVSYVMFYLYQRIDVIYEMAIKNKLEMTCSHIITLLGKVAFDAAKYDITLASVPLRFIGKFAKKAVNEGFEETTLTASCVLFEVGKAILTETDITYAELKDPFLSIVNGMELIAKGSFQRDKNMNIRLLIQPFADLKALFDQGKAKEHQDRTVIVQNIDRVIGEFEALLLVMNTIPQIPEVPENR